jgi:hypothetical protein
LLNTLSAARRLCEVCGGILREGAEQADFWADKRTANQLRKDTRAGVDLIQEAVVARLQADQIAPDMPTADLARELGAVADDSRLAFRSAYDKAYQATGQIGFFRSAAEFKLQVRWDQENTWAKTWLQTYAFEASDATLARMTGDVGALIRRANALGLSIPNTVAMLRPAFEGMKTWQLERIAITELHTANQAGVHLSFLDAKVEYQLWISQAGDPRTRRRPRDRADHVVLNNEVTKVGERFSNGLLFPGDKAGPIVEWIRCRCRKRPWIPPKGWAARATPFKV